LHVGIVQLGVGVANFSLGHKQFKSLGKARGRSVPLGQRTHQLGVVGDESRADEVLLDVVTNERIQQAGGGVGWVALHLVLLAKVDKEPIGFG
jgi:hypothetical protein